jgi:hypothetical protein
MNQLLSERARAARSMCCGVGSSIDDSASVGAAQQRGIDHRPLHRVEDDQPVLCGQITNARNGSFGGDADDDMRLAVSRVGHLLDQFRVE